jgi:mannose-6-phosphate isomerase
VPHAHLSGAGLEIMGSSDNVVRAGLMSKPVDG